MLVFGRPHRGSLPRTLPLSLAAAALLALSASPTLGSGPAVSAATGRPAATITRDGIGVAVPPRGMGVRASALMVTGEVRALQVETTADGRVLILEEPSSAAPATPPGSRHPAAAQPAGSPSACSDTKYHLTTSWWHSSFHWRFKSGSKPSSMSIATAEKQLKTSVRNITDSRNDCGRSDRVSASAVYEGRTTRGTKIGSNSTCNVTDGYNVVDFGDLSSSTVGFTCWWYEGSHTVEADVRLNKQDFGWAATVGSCFNQFIIQGVATHEFGHVFGLGHVSQGSHANLTMSTAIYLCDDSDATLGLGDMLGLEKRY